MKRADVVLDRLKQAIACDLDIIAARFVPGAKLTLIIRNPSVPDGTGDLFFTNETHTEDAFASARRLETENGRKP